MSPPFSRSLLFKWLRLITIIVLLPLIVTYFHLYNFLRHHGGVAKIYPISSSQQHNSGIYFHSHSVNNDTPQQQQEHLLLFVPTNDLFAPSIVQLVGRLEQEPPRRVQQVPTETGTTTTDTTSSSQPLQIVDYSKPILSLDSIVQIFSYSSSSQESHVQKKITNEDDGIINTPNQYGFRTNRNRNKRKVERINPVTTYFWIALNVSLFVLYKVRNIDPSTVSLNNQVWNDYGRSITGNLAHFDVWHIGMNMMSTWTLGRAFEMNPIELYGTIPLFLYTSSLLVVNTLVVLALHQVRTWYNCYTQSSSSSSNSVVPFPSMVGFSGILFAWSVVATLQTQQETCPILFLPDMCFRTYHIAGGQLSVSLGPLVQLVFLQLVLPRASFLGHLAGIVVGFLWHWKILPPLEYIQPCILYPIIWGIGKWYRYYNNNNNNNDGNNMGTWQSSISGGSTTLAWSNFQSSTLYTLLRYTRNILLLHLGMMMVVIHSGSDRSNHHNSTGGGYIIRRLLNNSTVLSQILLVMILAWMIQRTDDKRMVGIIGRGLVVMVLVVAITDAMTLGGWLAIRPLWLDEQQHHPYWTLLLVLWCTRFILWAFLLCLICQTLSVANELVGDFERDTVNDIWIHLLGWSIVDACRPIGKVLAEYGGSNYLWQGPGRASSGVSSSSRYSSILLSTPTSETPSPLVVSRYETTTSAIRAAQKRCSSRESKSSTNDIGTSTEETSSRVVSDFV